MNIVQKRDTLVFVSIIIFVAFLLGYNGIYKYNLKKLASVKYQIEEEKRKNEILKSIGILDTKLAQHQKRSFSSTEITPLLKRISELARQAQVEIKTLNPQPIVYKEEYTELPLEIPLLCNYHQLGRFLSLIESNPEFIWVKQVKMQKPTVTEPSQTQVPAVDLTLSGLYLKK